MPVIVPEIKAKQQNHAKKWGPRTRPHPVRFSSPVFVLAATLFFLCMACVRHVPPPAPGALFPPLTKEEAALALEKNATTFSTVKSFLKAMIEFPEKDKLKKQSFDAALLFRKGNEALRFQAFGAFGKTLFDLLWKENEITLYVPSSAAVYNGSPREAARVDYPPMFSLLGDLISGVPDDLDVESCAYDEKEETLWIRDRQFAYALKINRQTLLLDKKSIIQNDEVLAEILYQKYDLVNGRLFPTRMRLFFPPQRVSMEFVFEAPTLDEPLADSLFLLTIPPSAAWLPLSKLQIDFLL